MGMDVYGKNPKSRKGRHFRNSNWWWHPLWEYCVQVGDDIIPATGAWKGFFNDGWGDDAKHAQRLSGRLNEKLKSGHTKQYAAERAEYLKNLPDQDCTVCHGNGWYFKPPKPGRTVCNACRGKGKARPSDTWYRFDEENVREFADFLNDSGGFEIH